MNSSLDHAIKFLPRLLRRLRLLMEVPAQLESLREAVGRVEERQVLANHGDPPPDPRTAEFRVFSQWGEDGIIAWLLQQVPVSQKTFIEFGVETFVEANARFLLARQNWSGTVIDGSKRNIDAIRRSATYWKHDLHARIEFVTAENIDGILRSAHPSPDLGLLSIDIDGNDYWVWKAIRSLVPRIVICEYNSLFGPDAAVSIPYDPRFRRPLRGPMRMCYGASLAALHHLACGNGYSLVAGNASGNNAFFVRNDCLGRLRPLEPRQAYVKSGFREARGGGGEVTHLTFEERQRSIQDAIIVDVRTQALGQLRSFL
jgi:hypothetical protein